MLINNIEIEVTSVLLPCSCWSAQTDLLSVNGNYEECCVV